MNKNISDVNRPQSTPNTSTGKDSVADRVGDAIEGLGHKISEVGMPGLGKKIHDLGDKMEKTHDDPNHPHDV